MRLIINTSSLIIFNFIIMDPYSYFFDKKERAAQFITKYMPKYLLSRHRVHKMFLRKCEESITTYQECLGDPNWRQNIDKFIPEDTRRKCYFDWVKVRRCASKNLGETFASKINFTRQLEDEQQSYDELVDYYEGHYLDRERQIKLELTKPDEEFEDIVEEADDGAEAEAVEE